MIAAKLQKLFRIETFIGNKNEENRHQTAKHGKTVSLSSKTATAPNGFPFGAVGIRLSSIVLYQKAVTMPMKSSAFSEAPPMSPPSISALAKSSAALLGLQLPP